MGVCYLQSLGPRDCLGVGRGQVDVGLAGVDREGLSALGGGGGGERVQNPSSYLCFQMTCLMIYLGPSKEQGVLLRQGR